MIYVFDPGTTLELRRYVGREKSSLLWVGRRPDPGRPNLTGQIPIGWYRVSSDGSLQSFTEVVSRAFEPLTKSFKQMGNTLK